MIDCPPLVVDDSKFIFFLDVASWTNFLLNPYVIYCIIFRSTKFMSRYRWYLLYHQLIAFASDVSISLLAKPVFLLPFTAAYTRGLYSQVVPKRYWLVWCVGLICMTVVTVVHLFAFRYLAVLGKTAIPFKWKCFMWWIVFMGCIPIVGIHFSYRDERKILEEWSQIYTCITPDILQTPNLMAYDRSTIATYVIYPALFLITLVQIFQAFFIIASSRAIRTRVSSAKLQRMQRMFLLQLVLQAFVPTVILVIPGVPFIVIMAVEIYGYEFMGTFAMASMSAFSLVGAVILIVMNPTYRDWLVERVKSLVTKEKTTLFVATPVVSSHNLAQ